MHAAAGGGDEHIGKDRHSKEQHNVDSDDASDWSQEQEGAKERGGTRRGGSDDGSSDDDLRSWCDTVDDKEESDEGEEDGRGGADERGGRRRSRNSDSARAKKAAGRARAPSAGVKGTGGRQSTVPGRQITSWTPAMVSVVAALLNAKASSRVQSCQSSCDTCPMRL